VSVRVPAGDGLCGGAMLAATSAAVSRLGSGGERHREAMVSTDPPRDRNSEQFLLLYQLTGDSPHRGLPIRVCESGHVVFGR